MNNYFKQLCEEPITGLKVIMGAYSIHLIEGEQQSVKKLLKNISNHMSGATPFYNHVWVLHFVDEQPNKIFNQWFCKTVVLAGTGKEIKSLGS